MLDLKYFYNWFDNYVKSFYSNDEFVQENIKLKEEHTKRVCSNAVMISKDLKLTEIDKNIIELSALFHDIGRFEQFRVYKTFNDNISENHALLGVRILKDEAVLEKLHLKIQEYIVKAIEYHNKFKIPENEKDKKTILFAKIIRDADKLDIYKVVTDYYKEAEDKKNTAIELGMPSTNGYSKELIIDILHHRNSSNKYIRNRNDIRLIKLSWIFDINFNVSLKFIVKKLYIEKTLESIPKTEDTMKIKENLYEYINKRISQ
jgi:putative nucleotidyltransferase with HDIG domain